MRGKETRHLDWDWDETCGRIHSLQGGSVHWDAWCSQGYLLYNSSLSVLFDFLSMFYFIATRFFWNREIIYKTLGIMLSIETALHAHELLLPLLCESSLSLPLSTHLHHHLPAWWSAKLMMTALDPESLPDWTWGLLAWWKRQNPQAGPQCWEQTVIIWDNYMGSWGGVSWGAFSRGRRETMPILNRKKLS